MLTADKNVLPDPGRGATACHSPLVNCAVPQDCRLDSSCIEESGAGTWAPLIVTTELVKLTVLRLPENLGLKTALSQTTSPAGTDWLLKFVEKHTLLAHGVEVGVVVVVVLGVIVVVVVVVVVVVIVVGTVMVVVVVVVVVVAVGQVVLYQSPVAMTSVMVISTTKTSTLMLDNMSGECRKF